MKKIRQSAYYLALFFSLTATLVSVKSIAAPSSCLRDTATTSAHQTEPDLSSLIAALSGKLTDPSTRQRALEQAIQAPPRTQAELLLQDRARLYLAASEINRQEFDSARKRLKPISTASPVAVDAGLLIAESWRLQGNSEEAVQWFLRIGRHFSDSPIALQGLLHAATSLEESNHLAESVALYGEVVQKAMETVTHLDALPVEREAKIEAVLSRHAQIPATLRQQLTRVMIKETPSFAQTRQVHRDASQEWQCLLIQQQQLELQSERIEQHIKRLAQASLQAKESLSALDKEITALEKQLIRQDFSAPQLTLRKRLGQARNEKIRLEAQQEFIARTQHMLPEALATTKDKLEIMTASFADIRAQSSQDLHGAIELAVNEVTDKFRNLAGESQSRLAEVQMQQAGH